MMRVLQESKALYLDAYAAKSYSQQGEDMILRHIFRDTPKGFYVDVGAFHPKKFSNTYFFYKKGWRGINIDPMPGGMKLFRRFRQRDINLEIAVGDRLGEEITYYIFNDKAVNGFSEELTLERNGEGNFSINSEVRITTTTLVDIFGKYLPANQNIDFMSVDVEGFELRVLKSNDWFKYRPAVVLVEILSCSYENIAASPIHQYLVRQGYIVYAKTDCTFIFKRAGQCLP